MSLIYRVRPSVRLRESGFLINLRNGDSYTLNETGQLIVRALQEGRRSDEIHQELVETFAVSPIRARDDVDHYLAHLATLELIYLEGSR